MQRLLVLIVASGCDRAVEPETTDPRCRECVTSAECDRDEAIGQELCFAFAPTGPGRCGIAYDPDRTDGERPEGWVCAPVWATCTVDADCGEGLVCVDGDPSITPPLPGVCQCGAGGEVWADCPSDVVWAGEALTVTEPRCSDPPWGDAMFCAIAHDCAPPVAGPGSVCEAGP